MSATKQKPNILSKLFDTVSTNHGTITGATFAPESPFSNVATSLKFTATSDAVSLGDFSACEGLSAFTIGGWALKDNVANAGTLFRKISTSTSSLGAYFANVGGMKFVVEVRNGAASYATWDFSGVISNNTWFHWELVFNGGGATDADKLKLFINKVERTLTYTSTIGATTPSNTAVAYIGWDASVLSWVGKMKDVRAYSTNLSSARITAIYDETHAPYIDNTNLIAQWEMNNDNASRPAVTTATGGGVYPASSCLVFGKLEDGSGTSCADESQNARTGTLATRGTGGTVPTWVTRSDGGGLYAIDFDTNGKLYHGTGVRPTSSFTVIGLFEFDALGGTGKYPCLITNGNYVSGTDRNGWYLFLDYSNVGLRFIVCNGTSLQTTLDVSHATCGFETGKKYHIAAVFDDTANYIYLYVNGIQVGSLACTHVIGYDSVANYTVGYYSNHSLNDAAYGLDGRCFWHQCLNTALDAQAVFDSYKRTIGVTQ